MNRGTCNSTETEFNASEFSRGQAQGDSNHHVTHFTAELWSYDQVTGTNLLSWKVSFMGHRQCAKHTSLNLI
jgi:hypothetical protein